MPEPITLNPEGQGAADEGNQIPAAGAQTSPQPSLYQDLQQKKGIKSEEDLAKLYTDAEKELGRKQNLTNKVKQQLENAGYTLDDEGNITQGQQGGHYQPPQPPQQPGYYPPQPPPETVYDPYSGQPITDPIALQLARMPMGQREAFIVNAMLDQREKQQVASFQADQEVLSKPEAKGFEEDVRKYMQTVPLQQRANKAEWEKALWEVKGKRYDQDRLKWSQQGVNEFINRDINQLPAGGSGGSGSGASLSSDQEQTYQWYARNQPGLFKDRAHFAKSLRPDGGR